MARSVAIDFLDVEFAARPFASPQYYGVRIGRTVGERRRFGLELEFIHLKVIGKTGQAYQYRDRSGLLQLVFHPEAGDVHRAVGQSGRHRGTVEHEAGDGRRLQVHRAVHVVVAHIGGLDHQVVHPGVQLVLVPPGMVRFVESLAEFQIEDPIAEGENLVEVLGSPGKPDQVITGFDFGVGNGARLGWVGRRPHEAVGPSRELGF